MKIIKVFSALLLLSGCSSVPYPVEISFYQLTPEEVEDSKPGNFEFERVAG